MNYAGDMTHIEKDLPKTLHHLEKEIKEHNMSVDIYSTAPSILNKTTGDIKQLAQTRKGNTYVSKENTVSAFFVKPETKEEEEGGWAYVDGPGKDRATSCQGMSLFFRNHDVECQTDGFLFADQL